MVDDVLSEQTKACVKEAAEAFTLFLQEANNIQRQIAPIGIGAGVHTERFDGNAYAGQPIVAQTFDACMRRASEPGR